MHKVCGMKKKICLFTVIMSVTLTMGCSKSHGSLFCKAPDLPNETEAVHNHDEPLSLDGGSFAHWDNQTSLWNESYEDGDFTIISSEKELEKFEKRYPGSTKGVHADFSKAKLVCFMYTDGSGSTEYKTVRMDIEDGHALVDITRSFPEIGTCDMVTWFCFTELKNEWNVKDVESRIVQMK